MESTKEKLDRFERSEKLRRIKLTFITLSIVCLTGIALYGVYFPKSSKQVEAVVTSFRLKEYNTGTYAKVLFRTDEGRSGLATLPRGSIVEKGDKIMCTEINTYYGTIRYRFIKKKSRNQETKKPRKTKQDRHNLKRIKEHSF